MSIMVTCQNCGKTLQAKDEWAGKSVRCPGCKEVITVPSMKAKGPPPAPAKAAAKRPADDEDEDRPVAKRRRDDDDDEAPVRKKKRAATGSVDLGDLQEVSFGKLFLLNMVTFGIYGLIYIARLHDKLPKERDNDPNFMGTILMLIIPFYNLFYGIWFVPRRLALRVNEAREQVGLEPDLADPLTPMILSVICCTMPVGSIMMLLWWVNLTGKVNELIQEASR